MSKNPHPDLPRTPIKSSHIKAIGYDTNTHHLQVEFSAGPIYDYPGVKPATHMGLMQAKSKGTFLAEAIKTRHTGILRQ